MFDPVISRKCRSEFRLASNRATQSSFARFQGGPNLRIKQSSQITIIAFAIILIAEQIVACFPCVLERSRAVSRLQHFATIKHVEDVRQIAIARVGQFIQGELSIGLARAAAHKNQFSVGRPLGIEFKKMLDLRWLAIFVNAEQADIEIVARILEIVGITAEESHLLFGGEDQADVIIALVSIEVVRAALIQGNDIRS